MSEDKLKIDELLTEAGLEKASQEEKEKFTKAFSELVDLHFGKQLSVALSEEQLAEFEKLSPDELLSKIESETDLDIEALFMSALTSAKQDFLQDAAYIKGRIDEQNS